MISEVEKMHISILKKIGFVALLFCALSAQALTINFKWTPPTTRSDGTALPAGELSGYRLYGVTNATAATPGYNLIQSISGGVTAMYTAVLADPPPGTCAGYYFVLTSVGTGPSTGESDPTPMMSVMVCPPKGPGAFSAQYQVIFLGK
jgi:hypothetical protein